MNAAVGRSGRRHADGRRLACSLVLALLSGVPAVAQTTQPPPDPPALAKVFKQVAHDFAAFPSRATLTVLGIGGAAALAVAPADRNADRQLAGSDYRFLTTGRIIGNAGVQAGIAAATYGVGRALSNGGTAHRIGAELLRAQVLTQSLTLGIKVAVQRERPNGGHLSFPSGHASTTFATATVLARHFDWRISAPTLLAATYVAGSRVHQHQHYLSDVVFGAALGVAAGRSITSPQSAVTWIPVITPTHVALMLAYGN